MTEICVGLRLLFRKQPWILKSFEDNSVRLRADGEGDVFSEKTLDLTYFKKLIEDKIILVIPESNIFHKTHEMSKDLSICISCKHKEISELNQFCHVWDMKRRSSNHIDFLKQQIKEKDETIRCLEQKVTAYARNREDSEKDKSIFENQVVQNSVDIQKCNKLRHITDNLILSLTKYVAELGQEKEASALFSVKIADLMGRAIVHYDNGKA